MTKLKIAAVIIIVLLAVAADTTQAFVFGAGRTQYTNGNATGMYTNSPYQSYSFPDYDRSYFDGAYTAYQTGFRNFSSLPKHFSSHAKVFSGGYRGRTAHWDRQSYETYEPTETPEPATLILFGASLAGVGIYRRFKR